MDAIDWLYVDLGMLPTIAFLQIPERAASLEDKLLYECDKCSIIVSREFINTDYRNFSYWDGGVDIWTLCDCCYSGFYHGMKKEHWL